MPFTENIKLIKSIPVYEGTINVDKNDIPEGKTFIDSAGNISEGVVPVHDAHTDVNLNANESFNIDAGLYREAFMVTANNLASQTPGTALASDIINTKTAWANGQQVTGDMPVNTSIEYKLPINDTYNIPKGYHDGEGTVTQEIPTKAGSLVYPATSSIKIETANKYLTGDITVMAVALPSADIIKRGKTYKISNSTVTGNAEGYCAISTNKFIELYNRGAMNEDVQLTEYKSNTNNSIGFTNPINNSEFSLCFDWLWGDKTITEKCISLQGFKTTSPIDLTSFNTISIESTSLDIIQDDSIIDARLFIAITSSNDDIVPIENFATSSTCDLFKSQIISIDMAQILTTSRSITIDISSIAGNKYIHFGIIAEGINPSALTTVYDEISIASIKWIQLHTDLVAT